MSGNNADWRVIGASVCGASHERSGRANQDALSLWDKETGSPWLLALADGHGSARSYRSDRGARLAVEVTCTVCRDIDETLNPSAIKHWVDNYLPREIVRRWQQSVDADIAADPLAREPSAHSPFDDYHRRLIYGTTLLTIVVTETLIFYLQLGDGDIIAVSDTGQVSRPLPKDERLFANETTSLCQEDAWRNMRTGFQRLADAPPALLLAATDGYANSFRDEANFLRVGSDFLRLIRDEGLEVVERNLPGWLAEASRAGSGDDITVGILYRLDALRRNESDERPAAPETA